MFTHSFVSFRFAPKLCWLCHNHYQISSHTVANDSIEADDDDDENRRAVEGRTRRSARGVNAAPLAASPFARREHKMPRPFRIFVTFVILFVASVASTVDAFGPRPRPRLYGKPKLPRHLIDAERALRELAPGGPAAAGLLSDGYWSSSTETPPQQALSSASSSSKKKIRFEEYALRGKAAAVERVSREVESSVEGDVSSEFTVELDGSDDSDDGVVRAAESVDAMGVLQTSAAQEVQPTDDDSQRVAKKPDDFIDDELGPYAHLSPNEEMFAMLAREARHHVNPRTGKPFVWGDTWMHSRGGGVGTGRPESRPRRITKDGVVEVMPAKNDAGYALVPTSADKQGLLEFYEQCNGPRWSNTRNWGVGEPCANAWHGVICVGGRVTELLLNLNNVACMGNLNVTGLAKHVHELRYIDLSDNLFTGDLPDELFQMVELQSIILSGNRITGSLSEDVGKLVNLRHIDLSANALRGALPRALGNLSKLEVLYLGESGIESKNDFVGPIPDSWMGLKSLKHLSLAGNARIQGEVPDWLLNNLGDSLEELTLSGCGLTGSIPPNVDQLKRLFVLDLGENAMSGTIPIESLSRLRELRHVRLANNKLTGALDSSVAKLAHLETFDVSDNALGGDLPLEFFSLRNIEILDVSRNGFSGSLDRLSVDEGLESSTEAATINLRIFDASHNKLRGSIPSALFRRAPHLRFLRMDDNALDGELRDDTFEHAGNLAELHARNNNLAGSGIPKSIAKMPKLASLKLSGNRRLGNGEPLPEAIAECFALKIIDLSATGHAGAINPMLFASMRYLSSLNLASNDFQGQIPSSLRSAGYLRRLELQNNRFDGEIPGWLVSALDNLEYADLSGNSLTGRIPRAFYEHGDGEGEAIPPRLPAFGNRPAGQPRVIRLGRNPLFCPLRPALKRAFGATCRETLISSIEPTSGAFATEITLKGSGFAPSSGCVFGNQDGEKVFIEPVSTSLSDDEMRCVVPEIRNMRSTQRAITVNVGYVREEEDERRIELVTPHGELFTVKV
jgi:Leucine-rich repeat (LRR) protein